MPRFFTAEGRLRKREVSTGGGSSGTWYRIEERDRKNRNRSAVEARFVVKRLRRRCDNGNEVNKGTLSMSYRQCIIKKVW